MNMRLLSLISQVISIPLMILATYNTNLIVTEAADPSPTNIMMTALPSIGAVITALLSMVLPWLNGGTSPAPVPQNEHSLFQQAINQLAPLVFRNTKAYQLLMQFRQAMEPASRFSDDEVIDEELGTPELYLDLLKRSLKKEIVKSIDQS